MPGTSRSFYKSDTSLVFREVLLLKLPELQPDSIRRIYHSPFWTQSRSKYLWVNYSKYPLFLSPNWMNNSSLFLPSVYSHILWMSCSVLPMSPPRSVLPRDSDPPFQSFIPNFFTLQALLHRHMPFSNALIWKLSCIQLYGDRVDITYL